MALEQILSVSGKPGLYRLVGQMKNGIIVEAIADGKRFPVHGSAKVSALDEISIYTEEDEVALREVFKTIYEKQDGKTGPDHKGSVEDIKSFFAEVVPDYDKDRVYASDMVKVIKWYNTLIEYKAYDPAEEEEKEGEDEKGESKTDAKKVSKPKAAAKPHSAPKSAAKTKSAGANSPRKSTGAQRGG